jgi:hypothetical protein
MMTVDCTIYCNQESSLMCQASLTKAGSTKCNSGIWKDCNMLTHKLIKSALTLLATGTMTLAGITTANAETIQNIFVPIDLIVFIPCANGGVGELVEVTGRLHIVLNLTFDNAGGVHVKEHFQPQGISGTGSTTGDKYQGTGVTQDEFNAKVGFEFTSVNNFRMIGQGSGNNLLVHETSHFTVNSNGTVTAIFDKFSVDCK